MEVKTQAEIFFSAIVFLKIRKVGAMIKKTAENTKPQGCQSSLILLVGKKSLLFLPILSLHSLGGKER